MKMPKLRIRLPAGGDANQSATVSAGPSSRSLATPNEVLAKEWSITDDVLSVSDAASFTVPNINGEHATTFNPGQRVEIDESDPDVAGGQWVRQFTGRVTRVRSQSDLNGGSIILVTAMDLGWHLTRSCGVPLTKTNKINLAQLISRLIDPSWGFSSTTVTDGNVLNRTLKQGRIGVTRTLNPQLKAVLPFIQVEPGQTVWDVLQMYAQREGFLLNVGAKGDLVLFRPEYKRDSPYEPLRYFANGTRNNIEGTPTLERDIEGLYSESQCWSTVVIPPKVQDTANPNAQFRKAIYKPSENPLPFTRLLVFMDSEAINEEMRRRRAIWKYQMSVFGAWQYTATVAGHSSRGTFYTSDSMIGVEDEINGVANSTYYIQAVRRSFSLRDGTKTQLTIRKPGLVDPLLQQQVSPASKRGAKTPKAVK